MENLKVKNVIISKQIKQSDNYKRFLEIVKKKHINVILVKIGDRVNIDAESYFDILWPEEKQISDNVLNNNSILAKFVQNNFSMLCTGDIEEIAEKAILKANSNKLRATVLKVAHHGSKTSSIEEFIDSVKPKIALIGVGENNNFGHPNANVISRIEAIGTKIYRTDKMRRNNFKNW